MAVVCATFALLVPGCPKEPETTGEQDTGQHGTGGGAAKTKEQIAKACAPAQEQGPLRWFHDDYEAALACARAAGKPLVIDAWAPWCHTCLSMKNTVLVDASLAPLADRFVWLRADTDRPENAALVGKFPVETWPTFFVVAPEDESLQGRHLGAATVNQFRDFLHQSETAYMDGQRGALAPDAPLALLREGDRAVVANNLPKAVKAYHAALAAVPPDWPRRGDLLVALVNAISRQGDVARCVSLGMEEMDQTGRTASAANFAYYTSECARYLHDKDLALQMHRRAAKRVEALIGDPEAPLSIDDRSDAMRILRGIRDAMGDKKGARAIAERQRKYLDRAVAEAPSSFIAETYQWTRVEVSLYLNRGKELIPEMEKTIAEHPEDYNPPYRLAWIHYFYGDYDKALQMADAALELAYGPRKANVHGLIANIHRYRGDVEAERAARKAVLSMYTSMPEGHRDAAAIRHALDSLMELEDRAKSGKTGAMQPLAEQSGAIRDEIMRGFIP